MDKEKKIKYDVNITEANKTKKELARTLLSNDRRVLNSVGAFSALYDFTFPEYKEPVLVLKTEEPGSKQILAAKYGKIENVCYDMINHLINDCIVMGAKPLVIQDAIICGKINKDEINRMVKAMVEAAKAQECVLTGGETSEQPGVVEEGRYILTSNIVGVVEKGKVIDGSQIQLGDVVIGVESSGIHTNGYTLVRKLIDVYPEILNEDVDGKIFIDAVLESHQCYYQALKKLIEEEKVVGMAHITGGGILENLNRILPEDKNANIDLSMYQISEIFKVIRSYGNIDDAEMLRTFNLNVGMVLVVKKEIKEFVMEHLMKQGLNSYEIGEIIEGNKCVLTHEHLQWD